MNSRPKILIADDNDVNVNLIKAQLQSDDYEIYSASDGQSALEKVFEILPDLVLLDIMMPKIDGFEVCQKIKEDSRTIFTPVIVITALSEIEDKIKALEKGADDFITKPFNKLELRTRVKSLLRMKQLYDELESSTDVIGAMIMALEAKDTYTRGHSERVSVLAVRLAAHVGLPESAQKRIEKAGLLHDIGKIGVSETLLHKKGRLTEEEVEHIKQHPEMGYKILQPLKSMAPILNIVRSYHERCDGKGYPDGLTREQIPIEARILAIADGYDSMTSTRPYRDSVTPESALASMDAGLGKGQWDDDILRAFIKMMREDTKT